MNVFFYREYTKDDLDLYSSIFSNEQVMKYAWFDCMNTEAQLIKGFDELLELNKAESARKEYDFAVFSADGKRFIGSCLILMSYRGDIALSGEIGYFILPENWGKGYATEIAKTLTDFCFNKLKLHRVVASCNANNKNSENVMIKTGMQKEGVFRKARYKNSNWDDEIRYAILKDERSL